MHPVLIGLGNPGEAYAHTRHNAGRIALACIYERTGGSAWRHSRMINAQIADGVLGGVPVAYVLPETMMNRSGNAAAAYLRASGAAPADAIVFYDDIDLPLGTFKVSFNRGSGGHHGVSSVAERLGTTQFTRIRIGIAPTDAAGNMQKPRGEDAVLDFILKPFSSGEYERLLALVSDVQQAAAVVATEGVEAAMNIYNE